MVKFDEKSPLKIFDKKLPSIHETTKMDSERHQSKYVLIGCNYFIKTLQMNTTNSSTPMLRNIDVTQKSNLNFDCKNN